MPRRSVSVLTEANLAPLRTGFVLCVGLVAVVVLVITMLSDPTSVRSVVTNADTLTAHRLPVSNGLRASQDSASAAASGTSRPRVVTSAGREQQAPGSDPTGHLRRPAAVDADTSEAAPTASGDVTDDGGSAGSQAAMLNSDGHPWEPSLNVLPNGSGGACGRVLTFGIPKSGIGSDVSRTIAAMVIARATKRTFVFKYHNSFPWSQGCPNHHTGWECFFHNISNCADPPHVMPNGDKWPQLNPRKFEKAAAAVDHHPVVRLPHASAKFRSFWKHFVDLAKEVRALRLAAGHTDTHHRYYGKSFKRVGEAREIAHAMWHMRKEFMDEIESRLAPLRLGQDGEPFCVIHIRRGDKKKEARRVATRTYITQAERVMKKLHGGLSVAYIMSDDYSAVTEAKRMLPDARVESLVPKTMKGHDSKGFRKNDNFQGLTKLQSAMALFTDLEAARRATVFVGTATSNMGALVQIIRSQPPSTAVDATTGTMLPPVVSGFVH